MTTIGLVSDTHLPRFGRALPRALEDGLRTAGVSRILHMGDFTDACAVPLFEAIAPLEAVAGNNDPDDLRERFGRNPKILTIEGVRIGMVHGDRGRGNAHQNALATFADAVVEVILYGHSHWPRVERHGDVLVANPGSPTDKRLNPLYSYGLLRIEGGRPRIDLKYYLSREPAGKERP